MVETEFGGDFVSIDSTKDGEVATILDEGQWGEITYQGKTKKVLNINVEVNGRKMIWTPGIKAGKACQKVWGTESKKWVGKSFEILHVDNKILVRPQNDNRI